MKPGPSAASITCLPIASPASRATVIASRAEASPATTSTSRILAGGLKKCIPTTRSGCGSPEAIAVTLSDEVLVASTQPGSTISARRANSSRLSARSSGAASMTRPQSASARRSRTGFTPSGARASASGSGSWSSVSRLASAARAAIPAPIVPAPTTPTDFTPAR